jgi:23S rRNA (uridine2552-2'-O)-methyltransferase
VATGIVGPDGLVVGCDLLPVEPVPGAQLLTGDFTSAAMQQELLVRLAGRPVGCVISDMAPNNPGQAAVNHDMTTNLVYSVLEFAVRTAAADSSLLVKMFAGKSLSKVVADLGKFYGSVRTVKPGSSRKESGELFLVARHLRPRIE